LFVGVHSQLLNRGRVFYYSGVLVCSFNDGKSLSAKALDNWCGNLSLPRPGAGVLDQRLHRAGGVSQTFFYLYLQLYIETDLGLSKEGSLNQYHPEFSRILCQAIDHAVKYQNKV